MRSIRKWAHIMMTALGAAYLTFVLFSKALITSMNHYAVILKQPQPLLLYLFFGCGLFALFYFFLHKISGHNLVVFRHEKTKKKLSLPFFLCVTAFVFLFYLTDLIASHPGGFSPDTEWQWEQAHSMAFDDHHPVSHTLLFLLLTRIWDNYTFMLLVQIAAFALGMGYLASTMLSWGFRRSIILVICAMCTLAKPTRNIMMYFWKDSTLSICFLFLLAQLFNLFLSNGEWLKKRSHWLACALLLSMITLIRHNAILITGPMLALMFVYLSNVRKACIKLTAAVLVLVIGVKGPLYSCLDVNTTKATYLETTGLPMTILCSSYVLSPETMPEEAYRFMERLEDPETAAANYELGNYNSIKWYWGWDYAEAEQIMKEMPIGDFLRLTWATIKGNTTLAVRSVLELTDIVWDPLGSQYDLAEPPTGQAPELLSFPETLLQRCSDFFRLVENVLSGHVFQKLTAQLGVLILLLLLACYVSIHQARGWASLWLILPVMCYNFGTMLLLCGPDHRFFHFNCLVAYPFMVLLLSKPRESGNG